MILLTSCNRHYVFKAVRFVYFLRLYSVFLIFVFSLFSAISAENGTHRPASGATKHRRRWFRPSTASTTERTFKMSAGFVVYRDQDDKLEYLILHSKSGGLYWGFPKGRVYTEYAEKDEDVAYRELRIKTGIQKHDVQIVPGFRNYKNFMVKQISKSIVYYLAQLINTDRMLVLHKEFHNEYKWIPYEQAEEYLRNQEELEVLNAVHEYLKKVNVIS